MSIAKSIRFFSSAAAVAAISILLGASNSAFGLPVANMPEDVSHNPAATDPGTGPGTPNDPPHDGGGCDHPDGPPTGSCPYQKGIMDYTGWDWESSNTAPLIGSNMADHCVADWVNFIGNSCDANDTYCDDKKALAVANLFFGGKIWVEMSADEYNQEGNHTLFRANRALSNGAYCQDSAVHHFDSEQGIEDHGCGVNVQTTCIKGYFYFDSDCNVVKPDAVRSACGGEPDTDFRMNFVKSSPISLLWTPGADIEKTASVSSFPLNPSQPNRWYAWRASAETPLLVFDPKHTGEIRSADQLFGNWTFGGKRTASAATSGPGSLGTAWRDGFEALATLDANGDGKISGGELSPLGLWFDKNQDAISQPGEIVELSTVGVTNLFVTPDNRGSGAQHVFAAKGFERETNGRKVIGTSVDWFAESADSPAELSAALALAKSPAPSVPAKTTIDRTGITSVGKNESRSAIAGSWQWRFDDERQDAELNLATKGYFVFSTKPDTNEIEGYSIVVTPFEKNKRNPAAGKLSTFLVRGTRDGLNVSFSPVSGYQYSQMASVGTLSADGKTLTGTSNVSYDTKNGLKNLSYHWTAHKMK